MSPFAEFAVRILALILEHLGPAFVRGQVDEWEAARAASDIAFREKFGEQP